jgi:hypothetical protein
MKGQSWSREAEKNFFSKIGNARLIAFTAWLQTSALCQDHSRLVPLRRFEELVERSSTIERYCQPPPPPTIGNDCQWPHYVGTLRARATLHCTGIYQEPNPTTVSHNAGVFTITSVIYKCNLNVLIYKLRSTTGQMPALVLKNIKLSFYFWPWCGAVVTSSWSEDWGDRLQTRNGKTKHFVACSNFNFDCVS